MAQKITTPLMVLVLFYLMIVGLLIIILGLAVLTAHDMNYYFKNQSKLQAVQKCRRYLEIDRIDYYEKCYANLIKNKNN